MLTLLRAMEVSIKFDTVKSGWSIVYNEGSRFIIISKKNIVFHSYSMKTVSSANAD